MTFAVWTDVAVCLIPQQELVTWVQMLRTTFIQWFLLEKWNSGLNNKDVHVFKEYFSMWLLAVWLHLSGFLVLTWVWLCCLVQTLARFNLVRASPPSPPLPPPSLDSNSTLGLRGARVCVTALVTKAFGDWFQSTQRPAWVPHRCSFPFLSW